MPRWMLVDSSGSMKPLASPSATHVLVPGLAAGGRCGSARATDRQSASPSTSCAAAWPRPRRRTCARWNRPSRCRSRCCSGIRHRQPACARSRACRAPRGPPFAIGTAIARSQGSQCAPVLVAGLQGLLDQQAAEARAVDEQVAFDELAVFQHKCGDEACFGMLADVTDLALDAPEAVALGEAAQEARVQTRVELVGIADLGMIQCCGHLHVEDHW